MTRTSTPTRLPEDVYAAAAAEAAATSRSVAQQIAHWARLGRELERSPQVNHRDVQRVLSGDGTYDALGEREQALVREAWDARIAATRANLNYEAVFTQRGEQYSEADADGNLVTHPAKATT